MATTHANIFLDNLDVPASLPGTPAYTVPDSLVKVAIANATVTNYGTTPEDLTVYIVPEAGSANNLSQTIVTLSIAPGETIDIYQLKGRPILKGGSIQAVATTATKLSLSVGGSETSS